MDLMRLATPARRYRIRSAIIAAAIGLLGLVPPIFGATFYVDGNCPTDGNGSSINCGSSGPKRDLGAGIALLRAGDTLLIRGVHNAHDGETGNFDGRYFQNEYAITVAGTASSPIKIQPYGYTTTGTGETVFLDGTRPPSTGWTKCTSCTSGVCTGVPAAACSETWYASDGGAAPSGFQSGSADKVLWAQKSDGSPTYIVTSPGDLTNSHGNYNPKRCNNATWRPCLADSDCYAGGTCTANSPEIDSYSPQNGGPILVRWGPSLPAKPHVPYNAAGDAFALKPTSAYVTIQGLVLRAHRGPIIWVNEGSHHHTIRDNRLFFSGNVFGTGNAYGITFYGPNNLVVEGNEIAYTVDETLHGAGMSDGSVATVQIRNNWLHNTGDMTVLGWIVGTPNAMTLGDSNLVPGNYQGSVIEGNLVTNMKTNPGNGSPAYGIRLENSSNNWIVRNNIVQNVNAQCMDVDGSDGPSDNNQIYNNIFINCGRAAIDFYCGLDSGNPGTGSVRNTQVYNNTFVNSAGGGISVSNHSGACTGNVFRNNIFYDAGAKKLLDWPMSGTFQNNIVYATGSGTVLSFNGRSFGCSGLTASVDADGDGTGNDQVRCIDPQFMAVSSSDLHLRTGSPAVDGGTSTGMPPGRTKSLDNGLAGSRGFPDYSDSLSLNGTAWDIGAVEKGTTGPATASIVLSDPSPTTVGTVTVTLSTSQNVVSVPTPLTLTESDSTIKTIVLTGSVPGAVFTGSIVVDSTVADGQGVFSLPANSLVTSTGATGNSIVQGSQVLIDKTPPASPANLRFGS